MNRKYIIIAGSDGLIGRSIIKILKKKYGIIKIDKNIKSSLNAYKCDLSKSSEVKKIFKNLSKNKNIFAAINTIYPYKSADHFLNNDLKKFRNYINSHIISYYNFNLFFYNYFSNIDYDTKIINISSIYGTKIPNFKIYNNTNIKSPIEYSLSKASLTMMTKYFANWSKFNNKKVYFNTISPAGIEDNQENQFIINYEKIYKAKMLKTTSLKYTLLEILNKKVNGKNYIITGGAKI
jgi:NAD(P)-dependent dehydrogenase (short-subunit alcohol dehydrogenase family)